MGREVRRIPAGWEHPKNASGGLVPLLSGCNFAERRAEWEATKARWDAGWRRAYGDEIERSDSDGNWAQRKEGYVTMTFEEWNDPAPSQEGYMPAWPAEECMLLVMYETCSEGTPISPPFKTPEELARWLADNQADAFAGLAASYEAWLSTIRRGFAVSAVLDGRGLVSGVEGLARDDVTDQ